ncbi:hypothetical protein PC122_g20679 [Phytophthora cactorum]|nr:hypothetical protein PC122_g20679 [Phytophthora cactorum]
MEAKPRSDSAPMEKMMTLMEQTQGMLLQQQQATRATTSGGPSYITAAYDMQCGESVSREDKVKEDIGEAAKSEKKNDKSKSVKDGAVNPREAVSVNGVDTDSTVSAVKKVEGVCRSPTKKLCCTEEQVDATKVDTVGPLENEKICVESVLNTLSEDAEMALTNRVGGRDWS